MDWLRCFIKSVFAGMLISIGGIVYLASEYKFVGAFLFSVGLFTILTYGFNLYTGKICYVFDKDRNYSVGVLVCILGNFVGCLIMGLLFPMEAAETACNAKLDYDILTVLAKGFGCGVLMFVAVEAYRVKKSYLGTFLAIPTFILAGFEHSIADMFYFCSAGIYTVDSLMFILLVLIGNAIGCALFPVYRKYFGEEDCSTDPLH